MEMLLMGASLSLLGLAVACLAFGAATCTEELPVAAVQPRKSAAAEAPARFFVDRAPLPLVIPPRVPIEALLLQIENHVRLEQAAAESFVETPTAALLHTRTISPLVN
jgi:hypothetical protein